MVRIGVVIVNYCTAPLVQDCLAALKPERKIFPGLEVIVVDGGSGDGSSDQISAFLRNSDYAPWVRLLALDLNGGFGWANNQAMLSLLQQPDPPEFIYLLNPDAMVEPGAIGHLVDLLARMPHVGAAGSQLLESDGRTAGSAFPFPTRTREFFRGLNTPAVERAFRMSRTLVDHKSAGPVDWVTGASVMLRTEALKQVGLFDDGFFLYFEEVELMWRLRQAGWDIWHEPKSRVIHIGGAATGIVSGGQSAVAPRPSYWFRSRRRFFARAFGAKAARGSGLAWMAGNSLWNVRKALGLGNIAREVPNERRDMKAYGIAASTDDLTPAIVRWNDAPGSPPAWTRME